MKFSAILALTASTLVAAAPTATAPSIDVLLYNDVSTTDALCSSSSTKTVTVQNNTCAINNPGFNSYKILAEHNFPANTSKCAVFLVKGATQCGSGQLTAGQGLNGTEINRCAPARNANGVVANQIFFLCAN